jgi:hypothetical protein
MQLLAEIGFVVLTFVYFGLLIRDFKIGLSRTSWDKDRQRKFINNLVISLIGWGVFVSLWSYSGKMSDFSIFPFNFMPVIVVPLIASIAFSFSKPVGEILKNIAPEKIPILQSFRFFVELLLWALLIGNVIPIQMTFEGRNFDIIAGITGPIIGFLISRNKVSKPVIIGWNILCLILLANIVTVAILSTPAPIRVFMNEPANTVVATFPSSWLPGFLVPLAFTLSFLSIKQMMVLKALEVKAHRSVPSA